MYETRLGDPTSNGSPPSLTSKGGEDFEKPQWAIFQQPRFTLIRAEDWSDNLLVEQKQMVRLQFWLWVLSSLWPRCSGLGVGQYPFLLHLPPLRQPRCQLNSTFTHVNECYGEFSATHLARRIPVYFWWNLCQISCKRLPGSTSITKMAKGRGQFLVMRNEYSRPSSKSV